MQFLPAKSEYHLTLALPNQDKYLGWEGKPPKKKKRKGKKKKKKTKMVEGVRHNIYNILA